MTKYQINISAKLNHNNGYIEEDKKTYYSSYVAHLLRKFEDFKYYKSYEWDIKATIYKIENIKTMTLNELGLHIHNDEDYIFISEFYDSGKSPL